MQSEIVVNARYLLCTAHIGWGHYAMMTVVCPSVCLAGA